MGLQTNAKALGADVETGKAGFPENIVSPLPEVLTQRASGEIISCNGLHFDVRWATQTLSARRAVSCLLDPEPGDVVALLETREGLFITDVLLRTGSASGEITLNARAEDGTARDLKLAAGNLRLEAGGKVEVSGKSMALRFDTILMTANQVAMVGRKLMTSMQDIVTSARKQMASFDTSSFRARNRIDRIEETDQLRAGNIQTQAEKVVLTKAGSALTVAKEDVRLDGKRISMG
ncbi:DUF3540 domain-containing protein [Roseibium sp. HPY-6]|uniref:DUF3540 domain-containing protein n=1 Tax=Roseibium sp. HPY-6 TaxID=3229852 RepID=UPI00338F7AC5